MTFADLLAEMVARGAEDNSTRNGRWANFAYRTIGNAQDWPFTEVTATGSAGAGTVAVTDVRKVVIVGDVSHAAGGTPGLRLKRISFAELAEDLGVEDVTETGTPDHWWLDPETSTIKAFPVGGTVFVRYHQRLAPLTGVQEPVFDEEYHPLIVDRAMVEVYKDADEFASATAALNQYFADLAAMAKDYQVYAREHSFIQVIDPYDG